MWIGGRPLDPIGEPVELDQVPAVADLLQILLNDDGDDDRIPESQQVLASVCRTASRCWERSIVFGKGGCKYVCRVSKTNCAGEA